MDGTRVIVALLLCLAPLGGVSAGAAQDQAQDPDRTMTIVSAGNTSEYLSPPPEAIDRTGQRTTSIDVAGAVGSNAGEVRVTYRYDSLQRAYREADTAEDRRAVVRNGTSRLVERVDALEGSERRAIQRYRDGETGERELLRRLAAVDREARAAESSLEWLEDRADDNGMAEVESRLALQRTRLRPFQGPVRTRIDRALDGDGEARVHVDAGSDGLVLAAVVDDGDAVYVREAHDRSARTEDVSQRANPNLSAAEKRLQELYPWTTSNGTPAASLMGPDYARLWRFTYTHSHGNLETYLDAHTDEVVLERQRKDPEAVPSTTITKTDGDLRVRINVTRAGGPLGVAAYDRDTDEPIDADVEVNGDPVGATDGERLWTVAPRGELAVTVTDRRGEVTYETNLEGRS